ncbi:MAG: bifunctional methylenetetrahydrofolate dehydrogenase/methenyltetrahydrofolate cyclohydrolase [Gemmatimonadota bacterium]|nr:bifunctional methylenetetrahydrofolate dehydrogenase/methenyltetrahydrofolate cyclohydrolase [Gemmatimonadota bacterium]
MAASLIDGKLIAAQIREEVSVQVSALKKEGIHPCLAVILVGDDPASRTYVAAKQKASQEVGIRSIQHLLAKDVAEGGLMDLIEQLNQDPGVHGILVQLPLPPHIDEYNIIAAISPPKDVDGFHPYNVGRLIAGLDTFIPCTPFGVSQMISKSGIETTGRHVVIVGRSNIVGKPLMNLLAQKSDAANATVTLCHSKTSDIKAHTLQADILIAAIGRARFITADMVKPGAVVIDVGINRVEELGKARRVGDVDFEEVSKVASRITPVPGGVGPMTVGMLMQNVARAARMSNP